MLNAAAGADEGVLAPGAAEIGPVEVAGGVDDLAVAHLDPSARCFPHAQAEEAGVIAPAVEKSAAVGPPGRVGGRNADHPQRRAALADEEC